MTCPNCGAAVADNRRFCGKCGTALPAAVPPDPAAPTVAPPPPTSTGSWGAPIAPPAQWGPSPAYPPPAAADPFAPPDLSAPPNQNPWAGYAGPPPQYPPGQYPPGQYGPGPYPGGPGAWPGYGYAGPQTSGLAVASLVLGLVGWVLCGVGSVLAIILGFVARSQIKQSWGRQTGSGMATAGIVLGFIGASFWLVALIINLVTAVGRSN